jgi:hypothetical protein
MSALGVVISRAASVVPLTLLSLALAFVVIVAVIRPTPEREAMVDRLGSAIKDLGAVISGADARPPVQRSSQRGLSRPNK